MKVTKEDESVVIELPVTYGKWQYVLINSDRHFDNPDSDQKMIRRHLRQAIKRNAPIIDIGDFFCAMQGKFDKRSSKSSLRPEHVGSNYLDLLVKDAVEILKPASGLLAFMAPGNHETAISDKHETNLTQTTIEKLNALGSPVVCHTYSGFTRFIFRVEEGKTLGSKVMWHTHGYGGGGPVTKDLIQASRQGVFLEGVDIVASGHTHDQWVMYQPTRGVNQYNKIQHGERIHLKIPSAKDKWGKNSWEDGKGMPPKPVGSYWLKFAYHRGQRRMIADAERAW